LLSFFNLPRELDFVTIVRVEEHEYVRKFCSVGAGALCPNAVFRLSEDPISRSSLGKGNDASIIAGNIVHRPHLRMSTSRATCSLALV
jgi:hypothetical protein